MNYREAVGWLYGQQLHGIKLGLEVMEQLCAGLGIESRSGQGGAPAFVHVAGTNGKGSVCAMLASVYRAAGFRTGLYTSPHLVTFRERMGIDGEMISQDDVAAGLTKVRAVIERHGLEATFFEIATALALDWFQARGAQMVVLETGLGGRLDATNVVTPLVSVLTPIDFDHEKFLGKTITAIAGEKCGIIKSGVPVVSGPQQSEAMSVITATARGRGCALKVVEAPVSGLKVRLLGAHQRWNAAIAREALAAVGARSPGFRVDDAAIEAGLARVEWPGRFQRVGERIVLDGAHNPAAATTLVETWQETFGEKKATLIFAAMGDKDVEGVARVLAKIAARVVVLRVHNDRACSVEELLDIVRVVDPQVPAMGVPSLKAALAEAEREPSPILIAGSLFLVGEALTALGAAEATDERSNQ